MSADEFREWFERLLKAIEKLRKEQLREAVYTVAGAAVRLGLSEWYVRKLCKTEGLEAQKVPGGAGGKGEWRITDEEIERFRREGKRKGGGGEECSFA